MDGKERGYTFLQTVFQETLRFKLCVCYPSHIFISLLPYRSLKLHCYFLTFFLSQELSLLKQQLLLYLGQGMSVQAHSFATRGPLQTTLPMQTMCQRAAFSLGQWWNRTACGHAYSAIPPTGWSFNHWWSGSVVTRLQILMEMYHFKSTPDSRLILNKGVDQASKIWAMKFIFSMYILDKFCQGKGLPSPTLSAMYIWCMPDKMRNTKRKASGIRKPTELERSCCNEPVGGQYLQRSRPGLEVMQVWKSESLGRNVGEVGNYGCIALVPVMSRQ